MILRRLGNKGKIADKIQSYFPAHKVYIEPFFGAGGMFFNKPKAKYNIVNDLDSDVFNLFNVVMNQKEELEKAFYLMPIHSDLLDYWKKNKETEPIKKALRFLLLSNFTYLGKQDTLTMMRSNSKALVLQFLDKTNELLNDVVFSNFDFRHFFKSLVVENKTRPNYQKSIFIYNDAPYLNTVDTYSDSNKWTEKDVIDLFDTNQATGCKFAYSEFNHPFILEQAKQRNLNIITIGERHALKNTRTEILITNYENAPTLF